MRLFFKEHTRACPTLAIYKEGQRMQKDAAKAAFGKIFLKFSGSRFLLLIITRSKRIEYV